MKILEIIPNLASGGAERFVVDLSNELVKNKGAKIFVLTFRTNHELLNFYDKNLDSQVEFITYGGDWSILSKIKQLFFIIRAVYKIKPNIIHCHMYAFLYIAIVSLFFRDIKYFYTVHNVAERDTNRGLDYVARKIFFKKILPITISPKCEQSFIAYYNFPSYCMIENGCRDMGRTRKYEETVREINSYKRNADTIVFINVARMAIQKNHQLLIEAFKKFNSTVPNSILLMLGHDGDNSSTVKKLVSNCANIILLGEKTNIADYLFCSDFFCLSSLWEGLPISLIEAGLCGVYPVCTPAGGVVDVIKNKSWGIISADFSCSSYINALNDTMKAKINKEQLKSLYASKYSMRRCATEYYETFKQLIDDKKC